MALWLVSSYSLMVGYRRFGGTCLHLLSKKSIVIAVVDVRDCTIQMTTFYGKLHLLRFEAGTSTNRKIITNHCAVMLWS
jgi:hypothetical protein